MGHICSIWMVTVCRGKLDIVSVFGQPSSYKWKRTRKIKSEYMRTEKKSKTYLKEIETLRFVVLVSRSFFEDPKETRCISRICLEMLTI